MLAEIFQKPKPVLGQIQLLALPGTHAWDGNWELLTTRAEQEAAALATGGVDGLILENSFNAPHAGEQLDTAGAIAMALLLRKLKQFTGLPVGISVIGNDPDSALAIAINTKASFVRLSVITGARLTNTGIINSQFQQLLHYKNHLKAEMPFILADISLNHISPLGSKASPMSVQYAGTPQRIEHLSQIIHSIPREAERYALILPDSDILPEEIITLQDATDETILIESVQSPERMDDYYAYANGLILNADIRKQSSLYPNVPPSVDMTRVEEHVNRLRGVKPLHEMDPDIFLAR